MTISRVKNLVVFSFGLLAAAFLLTNAVATSAAGGGPKDAPPAKSAPAHKSVAAGALITVNSTSDDAADDGACTLREAITSANSNTASGAAAGECAAGSGDDTIRFSLPGGSTITLASALPDITTPMTISGPGAAQLTISSSTVRVFNVSVASPHVVGFSGLRVANGNDAGRGAIFQSGTGAINVKGSAPTGNSGEGGPDVDSQRSTAADDCVCGGDDGLPGALQFSASNYTDGETNADHTFSVTVHRVNGSNNDITVQYTISDGTATNGSDYTFNPNVARRLFWAAGDSNPKSFQITVKTDGAAEPPETVIFTLSNPTNGAQLGSPITAQLTITDFGAPNAIVVNSTSDDAADDGACTLREAITSANSNTVSGAAAGECRAGTNIGPDVIVFSLPKPSTITLTRPLPAITTPTNIVGPSAPQLTISGNHVSGIFSVQASSSTEVSFYQLTIANGRQNIGPALRMINNPMVLIFDCVFSGNSSTSVGGGAIFNDAGTLNIFYSTFSGNSATNNGGAILNAFGTTTVADSTLSGNSAGTNGGALDNDSLGTLNVRNCTISNNSAARGGGIGRSSGTVNLANSIVAKNTATTAGPDLTGSINSQGYNLVGDSTGASITPKSGDQFGTASPIDPLLGPLADNGGQTRTHRLLAGSPALDRGKDLSFNFKDQRGQPRPFNLDDAAYPNAAGGDGSDIGSYEAQLAPANTAPTASASPNPAVTNEDTPAQITLTGTDTEDDNLTFSITQHPTNGTLSAVSAPDCMPANNCTATVTYTPAQDYNGADSFQFKTNDGAANSNVVTVQITVNAVADLRVSDVTQTEGNSGTSAFTFNVTLDSPAPAGVGFSASTSDGVTNPANSGSDYVGFANQPGSIAAGQTQTTVNVTVNGDTAQEPNETFFLNVSNVTGATPADAQGQGTILNDDGAPTAGQIIISEFRLRGPVPAGATSIGNEQGQLDEFIELYNTTDSDFVVVDSSPLPALASRGWAIVSDDPLNPDPTELTTAKFTIPVGTRIPARGHYLVTNALGYSLSAYAAADVTPQEVGGGAASYNADIPDGSGLSLYRTGNPASFTPAERLDAFGFNGSAFFEMTPLQPAGGITSPLQHSFVRRFVSGRPQDTGNNGSDFEFVAVGGATSNGRTAVLGAPGPENSESPIERNASVKFSLIDPAAAATAPPNRVRSSFGANPTNAAYGTLSIQRRFKNTTGAPITRLRFRIVDITTLNSPVASSPQADLRVLSSTGEVRNSQGGLVIQVMGLTLEQPPVQANGGGLNSTLTIIPPGGSLPNGNSIDVQFLLGVQQQGSFRFLVNVEAPTGAQDGSALDEGLKTRGTKSTRAGKALEE